MTENQKERKPLISVENMKKYYPVKNGIIPHVTDYVKAVDGGELFHTGRADTRTCRRIGLW